MDVGYVEPNHTTLRPTGSFSPPSSVLDLSDTFSLEEDSAQAYPTTQSSQETIQPLSIVTTLELSLPTHGRPRRIANSALDSLLVMPATTTTTTAKPPLHGHHSLDVTATNTTRALTPTTAQGYTHTRRASVASLPSAQTPTTQRGTYKELVNEIDPLGVILKK